MREALQNSLRPNPLTEGARMWFASILSSDRARDPELWATIWQGDPRPSIDLIGACNLANNGRVVIWA